MIIVIIITIIITVIMITKIITITLITKLLEIINMMIQYWQYQ